MSASTSKKKYPDHSLNARTELRGLLKAEWDNIAGIVDRLVDRSKLDGVSHTCALQYFTSSNSITLIVETSGSNRNGMTLSQYVEERKYFTQSSLALGLSFSTSNELIDVVLTDGLHKVDIDLAAQVAGRKFKAMPTNVPPYARKTPAKKHKKR